MNPDTPIPIPTPDQPVITPSNPPLPSEPVAVSPLEAVTPAPPAGPYQPIMPMSPPVPETPLQPVVTTGPEPAQPVPAAPEAQMPKKSGKKKKLITLLLIVVIIILLFAASAAAYFGIVLPNKPENKLAKAFTNLAAQKHMTLSGSVDYQDKQTTSTIKGAAVDYTAKIDVEKNLLGIAGDVGISGAKFPFELRYVEKDIYAKVGGLNGLSNLLPAEDQAETAASLQMLSALNDKWYVVDRSYLQSAAGASGGCSSDLSFALNDQDLDKIESAYQKHPLFKVKNSSAEKVDGVDTTKYELDPASDETAGKFAHELSSLSLVEKIKACIGDNGVKDQVKDEINKQESSTNGTIYAYITPDKQIKKLELLTDDDKASAKIIMNFDFKDVEITKPDGAKPIQDLLGDIFGGSMTSTNNDQELNVLFQ